MPTTSFGYLKFEGTTDLLLTGVPVGIVTFQASGSITAGNAVVISGDMAVSLSTGAVDPFGGVALKTATDGDKVGVLVFGALKNLVAAATITAGQWFVPANNGGFISTGSTSAVHSGKAFTGASSGSTFLGFVAVA